MNKRFVLSTVMVGSVLSLSAAIAYANMAPPVDFVLGVSTSASPDGPRISSIQKGSSAERAGLKVGDIVLGADGRYTKAMTAGELEAYFKGSHWHVELIVVHDGKTIDAVRVYR